MSNNVSNVPFLPCGLFGVSKWKAVSLEIDLVVRAKPIKGPSKVMVLSIRHQNKLLMRDFRAEAQAGWRGASTHSSWWELPHRARGSISCAESHPAPGELGPSSAEREMGGLSGQEEQLVN